MADFSALLKRMQEQREFWVDLSEGRRLQMRRPPELHMPALAAGVRVEQVVQYACGWHGFTESALLGPKHGSADSVVPFARELWECWVLDNAEDYAAAARGLARAVEDYLRQRGEAAKNSEPSST